MAFCTKCGTQMNEGAQFCASCGTQTGGAAIPQAAEKVGNIRKCPSCGAAVESFQIRCGECGHEFSNVKANTTVQAFFEKMDAIDQQAYDDEIKSTNKGFLDSLVSNLRDVKVATQQRKVAMIEGFPIPNSKEDIIEFLILATPRFKNLNFFSSSSFDEVPIDKAWRAKCEQAYTKAKLSFGSDQSAIGEIEKMLKAKKIIK